MNRNDQRREATGRRPRAELDSCGMASVRILDADGKTISRAGLDPLDSADLARASRITGLPVEHLARAALDCTVLDRLAAGRPETKTGADRSEPLPAVRIELRHRPGSSPSPWKT